MLFRCCLQHRRRAALVARQHAVGKIAVHLHELLAAFELAHHHPPVAIGLIVEIGMRGEQPRRAAGLQQRGVKALVQRIELLRAFGELRAGALHVALHPVQCCDDAGLPVVLAELHGQAQRLLLDDDAHAGDVAQVGLAHRRDAKAALAERDDELPRHQARQPFPHRRRAHAVAFSEIHDAEPRSGRQSPGEDVALDQRRRALAQRIGGLSLPLILPMRAAASLPHFRISFARSTLFCISFCCFITSTHQARSLAFSSGCE